MALGGAEAVAKHHERAGSRSASASRAGRRGSFQEVGKLTGRASYDGDGALTSVHARALRDGARASIDGRPVAIGGEDFTMRGGTSWGGDRKKGGQGGFVEDLAPSYRIPLVNLIDGAGGSVTSIKRRGHSVFPGVHGFERSVELLGKVPVVSAVLGTAAGGPAGRAILSHWSVMVKGTSQIFAAGPPVVERSLGAEDRPRKSSAARTIAVDLAGTIDNVAESEDDVLRADPALPVLHAAERLGAAAGGRRRPIRSTAARRSCCRIVPRDRRQPYDMRKLIGLVVDRGSLFEIQPTFGKALITCLARMNGKVVGVVANNPMVYGGAMDVKAARKQTHFIELCDCFHIPLVFLVDVPGFMVGTRRRGGGDAARGHARGLRRPAGDGADVHGRDPQVLRHGRHGRRPTRTASTSRSPGRRPNGARCRSRAASPRRSGARSRRRPIPKAREREIEAELRAHRLAVPHRRSVRRRGHHRSARDARLSLPLHRCGAGAPPHDPGTKSEIRRAAVRQGGKSQ